MRRGEIAGHFAGDHQRTDGNAVAHQRYSGVPAYFERARDLSHAVIRIQRIVGYLNDRARKYRPAKHSVGRYRSREPRLVGLNTIGWKPIMSLQLQASVGCQRHRRNIGFAKNPRPFNNQIEDRFRVAE